MDVGRAQRRRAGKKKKERCVGVGGGIHPEGDGHRGEREKREETERHQRMRHSRNERERKREMAVGSTARGGEGGHRR